MKEDEIIRECVKNGWTLEEYFVYWIYLQKSKGYDVIKLYIDPLEISQIAIKSMIDKGVLRDGNIAGTFDPLYVSLSPKYTLKEESFEECFDELYNTYPPIFPLSDGKNFIARTGGDKNFLQAAYIEKLRSGVKHEFVMRQLERYVTMVKNNKINGRRFVDFINESMWDTIAIVVDETGKSVFKEDI